MLPCITPTLETSLAKISFSWRGSSSGFDNAGGVFDGAGMDKAFEGLNAGFSTTTPHFILCSAYSFAL